MTKTVLISDEYISLGNIEAFISGSQHVELDAGAREAIKRNRAYLEERLRTDDREIYGVNTGFGSLCDVRISAEQTEQLQYNLIVSHACGQGAPLPRELCRLILLLKIKNLSFGYSGVRLELVEQLIRLYNEDLIPVIYEQGSLGASGDLVPLAHMSLPLIGLGELWYGDKIHEASPLLEEKRIKPITLSFKEGLALINGTQFSLAYALWASHHSRRLERWANLIAGISVEAFQCSLDPFDRELNAIRNQQGQIKVAAEIREICRDSEILKERYKTVQDPYSFRCIPQVHGASADTIDYVSTIVERELNSVTDNPNIFDREDKILSGGNFHAQALALPLDFLAIALSELANISERRIYKLVNGERGLPDYLTAHPGLNSGFMIPQYTAASIVSQNKQLCTPASVDSISSSKGQEDHVSMAANAATRTYRVVDNVYKVLGIELMTAMQALEFRKGLNSSVSISRIRKDYREKVDPLSHDRELYPDIRASIAFIKERMY